MFYEWATYCLSRLPRTWQEWIYRQTIREEYIPFHVSPGSMWAIYEAIGDAMPILERIPYGMRWADVSIFPGEEKRFYLFFNFFRVKTPYFEGNRLEIVTTIKDQQGKVRFLILDYHTDTISSDPLHLFRAPDCSDMVIRPMQNWRMDDRFEMDVWASPTPEIIMLDEFVIQANEQIYYADSDRPNLLFFDKDEVRRVIRIKHLCEWTNRLWTACRGHKPDLVFVYPHPVSFLIRPESIDEKNES